MRFFCPLFHRRIFSFFISSCGICFCLFGVGIAARVYLNMRFSIQISTQKNKESEQKNQNKNTKYNENTDIEEKSQESQKTVSLESLSGTWKGDENIDKIVILRGGRGFVIFNNGASMNILIKNSPTSPNQILVTQNSKSNASFFPELPRNIALQAAVHAQPIQWILNILDENTLQGVKQTLLPDGDNYINGEIPVEWNKK